MAQNLMRTIKIKVKLMVMVKMEDRKKVKVLFRKKISKAVVVTIPMRGRWRC